MRPVVSIRFALLCHVVCKSLEGLPSILFFTVRNTLLKAEYRTSVPAGLFFSTWQRLIDFIFLLACVSQRLEMSMALSVYFFTHIVNKRIALGTGYAV